MTANVELLSFDQCLDWFIRVPTFSASPFMPLESFFVSLFMSPSKCLSLIVEPLELTPSPLSRAARRQTFTVEAR